MNPLAEPLCFEQPLLMLGGAPVPMHQLERELGRGLPLIAADGGANHLLGSDIFPEAIVGDMDSLQHRANWAKRSRLIPLQEQDSTDFEKCLYSARAPSYVALGFASARLDHTLACLHTMAKRVHTHRVVLLGEVDVMLVCSGKFEAELALGLRFSVFPLTPVRFARSQGLQYPLHDLRLAVGECVGTSNRVNASYVSIEPYENDTGVYAIIAPLEAQASFEHWSQGGA